MSSFWRAWLVAWCGGVLIFGLVLAGGAFDVTSGPVSLIYQSLQGPSPLVLDPAMRFTLAVMGCVSIGWAVTMLMIVLGAPALGDRARPVWIALTAGVVAWFVTDSALSAATGFGFNIVPNTLLMATYLIAVFGSGALKRTAG